ncbi:MAG: 3-phosphoshikimate 1-carboxyvinyltransferase, partial [Alphaproteobacteria bacterium MarineAlpha9_Bin4]
MYINKSKIILNIKKLDKTYFSKSKNLTGSIIVPGDKSISQRALIIGLISTGKTVIEDILDSEDVYHTLKAIESLGALVNKKKDLIEINGIGVGNLKTPEKPIYMGNSGTGTRLLLGLVAGSNALVTFYGDQSLSNRPMERVISPLEDMGATIICSKDKKLPITIKGARAKGFIM